MKKFLAITTIICILLSFVSIITAINYKKQIDSLNVKISELNSKNISSELIQQVKHPIEINLEKCVSENFMTDGINECTYKAIEAWNNEALIYTNKIIKDLNDDTLKLFEQTQSTWQNYYNQEKDLLDKTVSQITGDIHTTFAVGYQYELMKQHAQNLKDYYFGLKN